MRRLWHIEAREELAGGAQGTSMGAPGRGWASGRIAEVEDALGELGGGVGDGERVGERLVGGRRSGWECSGGLGGGLGVWRV